MFMSNRFDFLGRLRYSPLGMLINKFWSRGIVGLVVSDRRGSDTAVLVRSFAAAETRFVTEKARATARRRGSLFVRRVP